MNIQTSSTEINKSNFVENLIQKVTQQFEKSWVTQRIQQKFQINLNIIVILYMITFFWILSFIASWEITFLIFTVPGASIKSMRSIDMKDKDDTTVRPWLVYWLLIAILYATSPLLNSIFGYIIPFYHCFKLGFIYWLQRDNAKGARKIYETLIKDAQYNIDMLKAKFEDIIDKLSNRNF